MGTYLTVVTVVTVFVTDLTVVMMEVVVYVMRPFLTVFQGLTLVHFPAQRKHFSWYTLGTFSIYVVYNSSQLDIKRLTDQNGLV